MREWAFAIETTMYKVKRVYINPRFAAVILLYAIIKLISFWHIPALILSF